MSTSVAKSNKDLQSPHQQKRSMEDAGDDMDMGCAATGTDVAGSDEGTLEHTATKRAKTIDSTGMAHCYRSTGWNIRMTMFCNCVYYHLHERLVGCWANLTTYSYPTSPSFLTICSVKVLGLFSRSGKERPL